MTIKRLLGWRILAVLFAVALIASACGGGDGESPGPGPTGTAGGEIEEVSWALPNVPDTLFVPREWSIHTGAIMSLVQEGLLAFGDDLSLTEAVADSWEQRDDTTYVYTLRDGVTFHDGSPVTAQDVVYSMNWHLQPDSGSQLAAFYGSVELIEATGDREVTVTLKAPDTQFQYTVAHMSGFIFKEEQLSQNEDDIGTPDVLPIGTGPYRVVEFVPGDRVVLERYDDYWGTQGAARRIVLVQIADAQTRLLAMRNGDIDGAFDISVADVEQWEQLDGVDVITAPSLAVYLLTLDTTSAPFDDIHVRKAIAHAVDKEGLVQAVLKGRGEGALTLNPPGMWAGVMDEASVRAFYDTLTPYEFDLDTAREELSQSSVPDGFQFSIQVPNNDPVMINSLLSLSQNLSQIGVTMEVSEVDPGQWLDTYFGHENLGAQIMAYFPDYADPANYPYLFLHSANATAGGLNAANYENAEVDQLLDAALQQSESAARAEALQEALRMAHEDLPVIPLLWPESAMAIRSDLRLDGYNAFWYNIPWALRGFGTR